MPCHVEESPFEIEARRRAQTDAEIAKVVKPLQDRNDALTHENDMLREIILESLASGKMVNLTDEIANKIHENQVEHRKEDLRRLTVYFTERLTKLLDNLTKGNDNWEIITKKLGKVTQVTEKLEIITKADPNFPLTEQLGFDPDDY